MGQLIIRSFKWMSAYVLMRTINSRNNMRQTQINGKWLRKMGRAEMAKWQIQFNIFGSFWTFDLAMEIILRRAKCVCMYAVPSKSAIPFRPGMNLQARLSFFFYWHRFNACHSMRKFKLFRLIQFKTCGFIHEMANRPISLIASRVRL